tara:strand:- start:1545 stop:2171 length:627 start_codon:yes stop_codon:yes gene_type:complete
MKLVILLLIIFFLIINFTKEKFNNLKTKENLKVIVIGNGKYEKKNMGTIIDNYDLVIRFNKFPEKNYEEHIGTKTNIWFVSDFTYTSNKKLINQRKNKIKTKIIISPYVFKEKLSLIEDPEFKKILEKREIKIPTKYNFGKRWPSTGLLALFYLIPKYNDITIFGFNSFDPKDKSIHFYDNAKPIGHSSNLEKQIIDDLLNSKKIKRL